MYVGCCECSGYGLDVVSVVDMGWMLCLVCGGYYECGRCGSDVVSVVNVGWML